MDDKHRQTDDTDRYYSSPSVTLGFKFHPGQNAVAQLVEALRYKPEGRGFNSR